GVWPRSLLRSRVVAVADSTVKDGVTSPASIPSGRADQPSVRPLARSRAPRRGGHAAAAGFAAVRAARRRPHASDGPPDGGALVERGRSHPRNRALLSRLLAGVLAARRRFRPPPAWGFFFPTFPS